MRVAGRYQLVCEIGAGGMGRVYQALDTETGRTVAAKVLIAGPQVSLQALLRFQNEGAVLSTLKHPNIVEVYGTFLEEHTSCIIMELLEGRSLAQILRAEHLSLSRIKHIMAQVAAALAYAHGRAIVHRDIKPDNIMVVGDDHVKVTDFGIARVLLEGNSFGSLTSTGMSVGTPLYMAPEQIEGQKVDGRTDVYSFGVVLYQMVTGRPPFEGDDPLTVAFKHVHKAPPPPGRLNPQLPEEWERVILVCLAKDPTHRFQTAASLESAIAALDVSARVTGQQQPGLGQDGPAGSETPREMALGHETRTLLEQGRTKEQSGQLQDALRDYRVALTVASPGPLRDELNQGVARVTARIAEETDFGALPEGQSPEAQAAPTGRAGRPAPGRRDRRVWAGGAALLLTLVVALLLLVRPGRGSSISAAALHAHQTATAASATSTSTALIAAAPLYPRTLHGPGAGTLTDPGPSTVAMGQGSPPTRDFVAQVRFHNPRDRSRWDYGLAFRNIGRDAQYRLVIASDRKWYLGYGTGAPTASRFTGSIRLGPGQVNELRATVKGKLLRFTVNGHRVADARLSKMQSGSVRPIMDIFLADTLTGRVLRYGQFSVWSSPPTYGPLSGALNHRLDPNNVDYAGAGVQVRDFVAEARFVNPYPSSEHRWDYGFMFRETGRNQQYRLTVTPDRHWSFAYGSGQDLREGSLTALNAGARESNDLRLVVKGKLAVFFVNGVRVATLDVSEKMGAGNVDVVTGNLPGDEEQGKATRYKNFVVWSLDR